MSHNTMISHPKSVVDTTPAPTTSPATSESTTRGPTVSLPIMTVTFPGAIATLTEADRVAIIEAVTARLDALFGVGSVLCVLLQAGSVYAVATLASPHTPAVITAASTSIATTPITATPPSTGSSLDLTAVDVGAPTPTSAPTPATAAPTASPTATPDLTAGGSSGDDSADPAVVAGTVVGVIAVLALIFLVAFLRTDRHSDRDAGGSAKPLTVSSSMISHVDRRSETSSGGAVPPDDGVLSRRLSVA